MTQTLMQIFLLAILGFLSSIGKSGTCVAAATEMDNTSPIELTDTTERNGLIFRKGSDQPITGTITARHPNGRLRLRYGLVKGKADGVWFEWHKTGAVRLYAEWRAGKGHGVWVYFHPNGEISERSQVKDDIWDGDSVGWHDNGAKAFESQFVDGRRLSPVHRWGRDGAAVGPWTELVGGAAPRAVLASGWPQSMPIWEFSFTPDLETVFIATGEVDGANRRILMRRWQNGGWTAPTQAPFSQLDAKEGGPVISPDGRYVYFSSDRHFDAESDNPYRDLYRASAASGWTTVERVTATRAYGEVTLSLSDNGRGALWTDRRIDGTARMGLYEVQINEANIGDVAAVTIVADLNGLHLNDKSNENYALMTPDGQSIIFANFEVSGIGSDEDLFISRRTSVGWSSPIPLSGGVNTGSTDSSPQMLNLGQTLAWRHEESGKSEIRVISLDKAMLGSAAK